LKYKTGLPLPDFGESINRIPKPERNIGSK
jgi:hypothetical protein